MKADRKMIDEVRDRIERQHEEALEALHVLSRYFDETPENIGRNGNGAVVSARGIKPGSQRDKIAKVLDKFKSVAQIADETRMDESAILGCLYAKDFREKVERRKIDKKLHFRMRRGA